MSSSEIVDEHNQQASQPDVNLGLNNLEIASLIVITDFLQFLRYRYLRLAVVVFIAFKCIRKAVTLAGVNGRRARIIKHKGPRMILKLENVFMLEVSF
jgi:hypothetical protein